MQAVNRASELKDDLASYLLKSKLEAFLVHEAGLLDNRQFEAWLDLLADDIHYWMPVRTTRSVEDTQHEFAKIGESAFFDDDKALLERRVAKLRTGFSWSEDPPSRTRHYISNVRVTERVADSEYQVDCNFILYRSRLACDEDFWLGRREDSVRISTAGIRIFKRHIFLDQVSLKSQNISVLF